MSLNFDDTTLPTTVLAALKQFMYNVVTILAPVLFLL